MAQTEALDVGQSDYKFGFHDSEQPFYKAKKGLNREIVAQISEIKNEPTWMRDYRLKALDQFLARPMPSWGADLSHINFDEIYYYIRPAEKQGRDWNEVPEYIKNTFDRLGIPEAERKFLAGVSAQYESEVIYHSIREDLEQKGVIFCDCDTGLREHPEIFKEYFGTIIPPNDNKFAALNSAVWSGGSFVYVPAGVKVEIPLQAYFRINAQNMGQFERTLIIAEPRRRGRPTAFTRRSSRSLSRKAPGCATRRSRTGRTTSSTWSPSARRLSATRRWSGSTATSAPRSR
jgi:Fe-S cluster assembly protein SufB